VTDDFDDLLGGQPAPPRRRAAPATSLDEQVALSRGAAGKAFDDVGGLQAFRRPVTINFLATVFRKDIQTITRRLIDCPHQQYNGRTKLYDFEEACSYIIKPKMTPEQFIKTLNAAHMPAEINKVFWDAQRSRVKYKIEAQEAWETPDVNAAMGDMGMTMKEGLATLTETMRERAKLTDEQALIFDAVIEDFKLHLVEKLEDLADRTTASSMFGKPLFGVADAVPEVDFEAESEA